MQTLTVPAYSQPQALIRCRTAAVYVGGWRRRDLKVIAWEALPAPAFGRVRLVQHAEGPATAGRIEAVSSLPRIGEEVLVCAAWSDGGGEFRGTVTAHIARIGQRGEQLVAEAEHRLAADLGGGVTSRWQLQDGQFLAVQQAEVRFNSGPEALASSSVVNLGGRQTRLFDASATAVRWTVADAIAYLLAAYSPPEVESPGWAELASLAGDIDLGAMDATGLTVGEALVRAAHRAGLDLRSAREGLGLVFYRPGGQGRRRSVHLQAPGTALRPAASNLWHGRIMIRRRPSRRGVLAMGERKHYESTFELSKGWDAELQTPRWRDFVRSESDDWPAVADVYRKWVLNEHGWYSGAPWNLPVCDLASISPQDFFLRGPRKFLPCLSADRSGRSLGIVVETRCSSEGDWRRWTGPVLVAGDECAVYLGGDALPADFFQAAVSGDAEVRVTATVAADARLAAEAPGDTGCARRIVDCSALAAWRKVHPTSVFHDQEDLGLPGERDDTDLLYRIANRHAEVASRGSEAELTLGWIDTSFHVGDIVERIDGRGMELSSNPDTCPNVTSVRHDFAAQTTTLIVSG